LVKEIFLPWPLLERLNMELRNSKRGQNKKNYTQPPSFGVESWSLNINFLHSTRLGAQGLAKRKKKCA